jgi:RNase P/RNase MRP subunit POP5
MVVKSKIGRKRYIVFKIESDSIIAKRDFIYTLKKIIRPYRDINKLDSSRQKVSININPGTTHGSSSLSTDRSTIGPGGSENEGGIYQYNQMPWVISILNNYGLIRCHHLDKDKIIELLLSLKWAGKMKIPVKVQTIGTTGTIRSARKKYLDKLTLYPFYNLKKG